MNVDANASAPFRDEHGEPAPSPGGTRGKERTDDGLALSGPAFPALRRTAHGHSSPTGGPRCSTEAARPRAKGHGVPPQSPQPRDTENHCGYHRHRPDGRGERGRSLPATGCVSRRGSLCLSQRKSHQGCRHPAPRLPDIKKQTLNETVGYHLPFDFSLSAGFI